MRTIKLYFRKTLNAVVYLLLRIFDIIVRGFSLTGIPFRFGVYHPIIRLLLYFSSTTTLVYAIKYNLGIREAIIRFFETKAWSHGFFNASTVFTIIAYWMVCRLLMFVIDRLLDCVYNALFRVYQYLIKLDYRCKVRVEEQRAMIEFGGSWGDKLSTEQASVLYYTDWFGDLFVN